MSKILWLGEKVTTSKTDIYYSNRKKLNLDASGQIRELDLAWFNYFAKKSYCGKVLLNNSYSDMLSGDKISLVHITPSIEEIKKTGLLYPSGGGLGTAIYCIPLNSYNTPHNLFNQFFEFQIPKKHKDKLSILYFEIENKSKDIGNFGVDYTLFGEIQCMSWNEIKKNKKKSQEEVSKLEKEIFSKMLEVKDLLNIFIDYNIGNIGTSEIFDYYDKIFSTFPSLRFILFEVLVEYILLYQNNKTVDKFLEIRELYNLNHKKIVYELCPEMFNKFKMTSFKVDFNELVNILNRKDIIVDFEEEHLYNFLKWRISFYLKKICISEIGEINNFEELIKSHPSLIGHILYREFSNKQMFEEYRTSFVYSKIFENKIDFPIYSILPKGELGINPNIDFGRVKAYEATYDNESNKIIPGQELDLKFSTKLISEKKCTIR